MSDAGPLALVGGSEWKQGCVFDADLLARAETTEVLVLPTAAAYEWPDRVITAAEQYFETLGATVKPLRVLQRRDAMEAEAVKAVKSAKFIYIADGTPMHLRSVFKDTPLWDAIVETWQNGATLAGSSAAATVLGDPMVDPRGGAFTLGLGLVSKLTVVPHWQHWTADKERRLNQLMPSGTVVAEIEEQTALIRWGHGDWATSGAGSVTLQVDRQKVGLEALADR